MDGKDRYPPEEWQSLLSAPLVVATGVALASPSGPIGVLQEMGTVGRILADLVQQGSPSPLRTGARTTAPDSRLVDPPCRVERAS